MQKKIPVRFYLLLFKDLLDERINCHEFCCMILDIRRIYFDIFGIGHLASLIDEAFSIANFYYDGYDELLESENLYTDKQVLTLVKELLPKLQAEYEKLPDDSRREYWEGK
jgi:hypothetical protein